MREKLRMLLTHRKLLQSKAIADSGPGIALENESNVFDPFYTTKSSGMGLGLSISHRIIEDHGGDLRLTKTGSNGATFEITLPM